MRRRDWAGTVFVACLIALAGLMRNQGVLVGLLLVGATVSGLVILWDVRRPYDPSVRALRALRREGHSLLHELPEAVADFAPFEPRADAHIYPFTGGRFCAMILLCPR